MKKLIFAIIALLFIAPVSFAQSYEHIENFGTYVSVNADGTIDVRETILYDFGQQERHGIFRNIPFTKRGENNDRFDLKFENFKVNDEKGKAYEFDKSTENEQIVLKIGDPDETITGTHTYVISYKVSGAIGYFNDHDEFYWNTTGNGWEVPISSATASIDIHTLIERDDLQLACYTGKYGSDEKNCEMTTFEGIYTMTTISPLAPYEGFTAIVGFPKGIVEYLPAEKYVSFWEKPIGKIAIAGIILTAIFWYLLLPVILLFRYFKHGRDPYVGPNVTSWYDPPETVGGRKLTPAETGGLIDENVDTRDIFATIIDLARRGYIKIKEQDKKNFSLIHANKPSSKDTLAPYEEKLIDGIFKEKKEIKLKDVKLYKTVQEVEKMIYEGLVSDGFFPQNPKSIRTKYYALGTVALPTFNLVLASIAFFIGRIMPRKTLYGAQQANVAKGIKSFINSQERQMNFQGDKQMFFEKLLPFAVAFGVEKNWAKRFEKFDLKNPDWYQSTTSSHFNAALLASSLGSSYSNFKSASTPPSSSSSGFSSGGGFSGGGGGGGGGGSW